MDNVFDMIKAEVPIHDLLDIAGVSYPTREKNVKVSCPFHGEDNRKSGFIFVDTNVFRCFTCNQNWDVIAFWAQANEWWKVNAKGEDVLDMGKATASLKEKYKIEYTRPSWEQKFAELKRDVPVSGFPAYPQHERVKMAQLYLWGISKSLARMGKPVRAQYWPRVSALLDQLDEVDLESPKWKSDLNSWQEDAILVVKECETWNG